MGNVSRKVNADTAVGFGDLSPQTGAQTFEPGSPVLATPAVAATVGATAAVTAGVGGFVAEEAADG